MQGLPDSLGAVGAALLVVGLALGAAYGLRAFRRLTAAFAPAPRARSVAAVVPDAHARGVAAAPGLAWRVDEALRYSTALDPWLADRYGVSVSEIHPSLYDRALELMGDDGSTFAVVEDEGVTHERRRAFELWALTTFLPRRAVVEPGDADWLLTLGVRPQDVGPPVEQTWELHPGNDDVPPAYLARVRS